MNHPRGRARGRRNPLAADQGGDLGPGEEGKTLKGGGRNDENGMETLPGLSDGDRDFSGS